MPTTTLSQAISAESPVLMAATRIFPVNGAFYIECKMPKTRQIACNCPAKKEKGASKGADTKRKR
ncbi:MAG: hypothetical protein WCR89_07105, partial [Bacteroidales bacterium]